MPRTKPADERRADLLGTGEALFVAKGVAATSLEDITNGAGVSKGLFYLYFRSKEDWSWPSRSSSRPGSRRGSVLPWTASRIGRRSWTPRPGRFDCFRELHDLHEVLFRHGGHDPSETGHQPTHAVLTVVLRELFDGGVAAGAFDVGDTEPTTVLLYVAMHTFDPGFHGRRPPTDDRLVRATQQLFRRTAGVSRRTDQRLGRRYGPVTGIASPRRRWVVQILLSRAALAAYIARSASARSVDPVDSGPATTAPTLAPMRT